jgi:hypothetical protein
MTANDPSVSNSEQSSAPPLRTFRLSSVKQKLVNILVGLLTVSDARKRTVLEDVAVGSVPRFIYCSVSLY